METLFFYLNSGLFLIGIIPLVISIFFLEKYVFKFSPKTSKELLRRVLQVFLIEFLIIFIAVLLTIILVVVDSLGGAILALTFFLPTMITCLIVAVIASYILYRRYIDIKL